MNYESQVSVTTDRHVTMREVQDAIAKQTEALLQHPFMERLERSSRLEEFRVLLPGLAFFTFAFQDILRIARDRCTDSAAARHVAGLQRGDAGHDHWYRRDLKALGIRLEADWLFSEPQWVARRASYALAARVHDAVDDRIRLSVLLSLEATAHSFFERVPAFAKRAGVTEELFYFGDKHLEAEESHEVFTRDAQAELDDMRVEHALFADVIEAIEGTFYLMGELADDLESQMAAA